MMFAFSRGFGFFFDLLASMSSKVALTWLEDHKTLKQMKLHLKNSSSSSIDSECKHQREAKLRQKSDVTFENQANQETIGCNESV